MRVNLMERWLRYGIMNTIHAYTNEWGYASRIADQASFNSERESSGNRFLTLERTLRLRVRKWPLCRANYIQESGSLWVAIAHEV
jgi:hypothetical protein